MRLWVHPLFSCFQRQNILQLQPTKLTTGVTRKGGLSHDKPPFKVLAFLR